MIVVFKSVLKILKLSKIPQKSINIFVLKIVPINVSNVLNILIIVQFVKKIIFSLHFALIVLQIIS
jgi:hypothetical protein